MTKRTMIKRGDAPRIRPSVRLREIKAIATKRKQNPEGVRVSLSVSVTRKETGHIPVNQEIAATVIARSGAKSRRAGRVNVLTKNPKGILTGALIEAVTEPEAEITMSGVNA
jgi:hypothetical protein